MAKVNQLHVDLSTFFVETCNLERMRVEINLTHGDERNELANKISRSAIRRQKARKRIDERKSDLTMMQLLAND